MGIEIYGKMMSVDEAVQFLDHIRTKSLSEEEKEIVIDEELIDGTWHELPLGTDRHLISVKESYERIIDFVPVEVQHEIQHLWQLNYPPMMDCWDSELPMRDEFRSIGVSGWFALLAELRTINLQMLVDFIQVDTTELAPDVCEERQFFAHNLRKWTDAVACAREKETDLFIYRVI